MRRGLTSWKTSAISDISGYPTRTVRVDRADAMAINHSVIVEGIAKRPRTA